MAKKVEYSVEERLRALYDLQLIDSRIDKIRSVRGELPLEVEDLEDEVSGLDVRIEKIEAELEELENGIKDKLNKIEESKALIKKYNDQFNIECIRFQCDTFVYRVSESARDTVGVDGAYEYYF